MNKSLAEMNKSWDMVSATKGYDFVLPAEE
jgi:hypothetical protein